MNKLIKYEWRRNYRLLILVLTITILGSLLFNIGLARGKSDFILYILNKVDMPVSSIAMILSGIPILAVFILGVLSIKNEIEDDSKHLYFSLPLEEGRLLASKLIFSLVGFLLVGIILVLSLNFLETNFSKNSIGLSLGYQYKYLGGSGLFFVVGLIIQAVNHLLLANFTLVISKISIGDRKIGSWWILLFLLFKICLDRFKKFILTGFPYIYFFKGRGVMKLTPMDLMGIGEPALDYFNLYMTRDFINPILVVLSIIIGLGLFRFTSYALKELIDI